jgi:tyrosine-protein kinase Etk/Wzc
LSASPYKERTTLKSMSEEQLPPVWERQSDKPIDLLEMLAGIIRRWPFVFAVGFGGAVLAYLFSLLLTPKFTSQAIFLPPTQNVSATDNPLAALLKAPTGTVYIGLLTSDTVLGDVVEHSDLQRILRARDSQDARAKLSAIIQVSSDAAGFVKLQVTNKDPKLAKNIAASFLAALGRLNDRMAMSQASQSRRVFQMELQREKDQLEQAEIDLKKAQESSGVILPQSQMQAGLAAIDSVRAEIRIQQVRLTTLLQAETDQAPEVVRARSQIAALENQLHRLENGAAGAAGEGLTASKAPSVNLEFVRLEREVKYHQVLFDVMAKQFENARLQESSAAPGVQVVDFPEVPIRKSWPKRSLIAVAGGAIGAFLALIFLFAQDRLAVMRQVPQSEASLQALKDAFRKPRLRR